MATVDWQDLGHGRSCWNRSSTSSIILSGLGNWYLWVGTESPLPGPSCLLHLHAGNLVSRSGSWTYLLSWVLPRKGHRSSLIPGVIQNLSEIFIPAPYNHLWKARLAKSRAPGVKKHLSSHPICSNSPPSCSPGSAHQVTRLRCSLNKYSSKSIACAHLSFLAPWRPGLLWSQSPHVTCLFSVLCPVTSWGDMCRNTKLTGQEWAKRKKEMPMPGSKNQLIFQNILPSEKKRHYLEVVDPISSAGGMDFHSRSFSEKSPCILCNTNLAKSVSPFCSNALLGLS